ncbi:c-type cytochrome [Membranihabitans maritimus]|uniref:c-type cytochrome n=1 Tax=Membranihabitans maritimus TaxID=2904244 RepID=UPI001F2213F7|nr:cytochrome c [Membranihabitans maritimus]
MNNLKKKILFYISLPLILYLFSCGSKENKLSSGREIYKKYCVNCHGADGTLSTNGALDLSASRISMDARKQIINEGRITMTGFKEVLSPAQIDSVAKYTITLQK